jgi:hypothetical protein
VLSMWDEILTHLFFRFPDPQHFRQCAEAEPGIWERKILHSKKFHEDISGSVISGTARAVKM